MAAVASSSSGSGSRKEADAVFRVSSIVPNLFLCSVADTQSPAAEPWAQDNIDVVIYLRYPREWPSKPFYTIKAPIDVYPLANHADEETVRILDKVVDAINEKLSAGKRLLVCDLTGKSRAPAAIIGYFFKHQGKTMHEACDLVTAAHPPTSISHDMLHVLVECEFNWKGRTGLEPEELYTYAPDALKPLPKPEEFASALGSEAREAMLRTIFQSIRMDWQDASYIMPGVWIGNLEAASSAHWLQRNNITAIVNCAVECTDSSRAFLAEAKVSDYLCLRIEETSRFPTLPCLKRGAEFVHAARTAGKNVLIHCWMGINRSVSTTLAYIMTYHRVPLLDALYFVKQKRPIAYPNPEMYPHLIALEMELFGSNTVTLSDSKGQHLYC